jgi:hypothetical protein
VAVEVVDAAVAAAASLEVEVVVAVEVAAVFRGAAAAASHALAAAISRGEVQVALAGLVRGICPAATEGVVPAEEAVWLIPETPHPATEVPLAASD